MVQASSSVPDYKAFRSVTTPESCSMLASNLSANQGTSFVVCKNTNDGGKVSLYGPSVVNQTQDSVEPTIQVTTHKSDCIRAQFLKVQGITFTVICHLHVVLIYNANCTRRLFSFDI